MDKQGYIYLFRLRSGWFKIGRTSDLEHRFRAWSWESRANRYGMVLMGIVAVPNARAAEKAAHALFDARRSTDRHAGLGPRKEWFALTPTDVVKFWAWAATYGTRMIKTELDIEAPGWLPAVRKILNG